MSRVNKYRGIHIHVHPQNKHLNRRWVYGYLADENHICTNPLFQGGRRRHAAMQALFGINRICIVPLFQQILFRQYWYCSVKVVYYILDWRDNLCS